MKRSIITLITLLSVLCGGELRANTSQSVPQVTSAVTLASAVDYHITSADEPFATAGSVNITNGEAVVIFDAVKPSKVISTYLSNIYINGEQAVNDVNCRVAININGAIVYPHPNTTFNPLTVYTGKNYSGRLSRNFTIYNRYTDLGEFDNCIQSFRLRRGYMVTLATSSNGLGYSRVWIAQDADIEVPELSLYLINKVSFIRVFAWNKTSKRGSASGGTGQYNALNATWFYDWSAGDHNYADYEYVPMRHHVGWPSFETIKNNKYSNTVLGNNEPDNTGDSRQNPAGYSTVIENWEDIYQSGMRVGSPAMASNVDGWLVPFMNLCKQRNYRIDFVAFHKYSYASGSSYSNSVNNLYNKFHRPVWLTEFNYGANWTKETSWPDSGRGNTEANQNHFKAGLQSILPALENNSHLERYSIYNWVQGCRYVYTSGAATIGGQYYASITSHQSYTGNDNVIPGWTYWAPTDLTATYSKITHHATFAWQCRNYEETDSSFLERLDPGATDWKVVARITNLENRSLTYDYDDLTGLSGYFTYRIHNYDNDGNQRFSGTASFTIGAADGDETLQYGEITIANLDAVDTQFSTSFSSQPAVFMGIPTNTNADAGLGRAVASIASDKFTFQPLLWKTAGTQELTSNETIGFMALPEGDIMEETTGHRLTVGTEKVNGDTCEVVFAEPFDEGVTPVVITELRPTLRSYPMMTRIWDVTNTGFKCQILYEQGYGIRISTRQTLNYIAAEPGEYLMPGGKLLTAGRSDTPLYGNTYKKVGYFDEDGDSLRFLNPIIFANIQKALLPTGSFLRLQSNVTERDTDGNRLVVGSRIRRQVDASATDVNPTDKATAETIGWMILSDDTDPERTTGIDDISTDRVIHAQTTPTLDVSVINHIVYVRDIEHFQLYKADGTRVAENATQEPGLYIVRVGSQSCKVLIR